MPERLDIVSLTVGYAVILAALGSGPAVLWARGVGSRLLIAPALGFALAASVLSTTSPLLTMRQAGWALLVPGCTLSLVVAVVALRREPARPEFRALLIPLSLAAVAVAVAVAPEIARDAEGPISLKVFDAWVYISSDDWLSNHTLSDPIPAEPQPDLSETSGYVWTHAVGVGLSRVGLSAVNAPVAEVLGSAPDRTHLPMLALLFALIPIGVWCSARSFGAGAWPSAFGAVFGLSAVALVMVADSALGNLTALALTPIALALLARGLLRRDTGNLLAAAILTAGLVCSYPEFLVPFMLVIGFECVVAVVWLAVRHRRYLGEAMRRIGRAAAVFAGVVILIAPVGLRRGIDVLRVQVGTTDPGALPPRPMSPTDGPAWAFGLLHLYQLPRFDLLSTPKIATAIIVPLILVAVVLLGVPRLGAVTSLLCFGPILVGLVVAAISYVSRSDCSYCLWKALTFVGPFLGIGVALGLTGLARSRRLPRLLVGATASVAVAISVVVLYTDVKLATAVYRSEAIYRHGLRTMTEALRHQPGENIVLLEGMDATAAPKFSLPSAYHSVATVPNARVSVALAGDAGQYLLANGSPEDYYDPSYNLVATAFPGLVTGRERLAQAGTYALDRRRPIDVSPAKTGWSFDPAEGGAAIPWLTGPFDLRVAGTRQDLFSVRLGLRPSNANADATLDVTLDGVALPDRWPGAGAVCVEIPRVAGELILAVNPVIPHPTAYALPATESDPLQPPPKDLGLASLRAEPGGC